MKRQPPRRRSEVLSESGRRRESPGFSRGEDVKAKTIPKTAEDNRQSISGQRRLQCPDGGQWKGNGNVLPSDSRGHLHISITFMRPYALYAPLLGVGPFPLREPHTAAYGSLWNRALVLLPVGIGASSARRNQKCIRISADSRRNRPPMKSIRLRPSLIPFDAWAVFAPKNDSLAPLTGFRPFGG